ncbi:MAG TPA: polyphosphate kinase 1 [Longimicrobium sp.]|nr:polyphosphate kinase 1 [Longimicrobium sp.]
MSRALRRFPRLQHALGGPTPLTVRFSAAHREVLGRIVEGPLPAGLALDGHEAELFRDVYYDTPALDLRRRGATVGVRFHANGELTLAVEVRASPHDGLPASTAETARVADPQSLFTGDSEAAWMLRALVDPALLEPWLTVETRRRIRCATEDAPDDALAVEIACDERTVRDRDVAAELFEVEVRLGDDTPEGRAAARALEETFGLTLLTGDPLRRWLRGLDDAEVAWLEESVRSARRVAVVLFRGGCAALLNRGGALQVPTGPGTGLEAARRVMRTLLGAEGRIRLIGTGPGSVRHPATEVWVSEDAELRTEPAGLVQLPVDELIEAVGSPALRDGATLAALHVLVRSGLAVHPVSGDWDDEAARRVLRAAPPWIAPASELADDALPAGTLLNPELSVLAFNRRVLELAGDAEVPLLERVRFLSIFGGNLDEFFRVRVAGYKRQLAQGNEKPGLDGVAPREQLDAVGTRARRLADAAYRLLFDRLLPELRRVGVEVVRRGDLEPDERSWLREYYDTDVHAVLTPMAAGPGHPFPHIRNQRPALAAILREPLTGGERLGLVELPDGLPRFVALPGGERWVPLEAVIVDNLHRLYPGMEVDSASAFRVTRSAELHVDPAHTADLLQAVEEEVRRRRFRPVVRVEVDDSMPERLRGLLLRELRHEAPDQAWPLGDDDVYGVEGLNDLRGLRELASARDGAALHWPPAEPGEPLDPAVPMMEVLNRGEVLVEFPGDSFEATVERFVLEAAEDPDVVAVKLALYRTNRKSRIVEALRRASSRGKQVVALVELTARFDEERNIAWARHLRSSGIHVVYGLPGLKVHAKVALVVRREAGGVRRYAYVGTGNLNATTAAAYTDLGLLTADPGITDEVGELFNMLGGAGGEPRFNRLLVAPHTMRARFVAMIDREAEHARAGRGGEIVAKVNGLADREIIAALYRASQAGVRVELIVRSLCALRPGVWNLSENIRVISILGRYLEHARIFRFHNGGDPEYYIGSADWRTRNLSRRVEVACPVRAPDHRARLDAILHVQLEHPRAWELGSDGTYYQRPERAPRDPALPPSDPDRRPFIPVPG